MADVSKLISVNGTETLDSQDSVTQVYEVQYESLPSNFYTALARARSASGAPVPARRSIYASPSALLIATSFAAGVDFKSDERLLWQWTVQFSPPPQGEGGGGGEVSQIENPLDRPAVFNVEYQDIETVIDKARNVDALSHGDGKGGNRAALTLGPIVNAAGKRPDEPHVTTDRLEVLVIKKNYATLAEIVERNRDFKRSTNDGTVQGYGARELRYLLTESQGEQYENGIRFWPGVTSILAEETTDLILDNVGYEYWDAANSNWVRAADKDGQPTGEPINLKLDGDKGGDNSTTITYRHLTEKDYGALFE